MVGDDGRVRVMDFGLARSTAAVSEPDDEEETAPIDLNASGEKALSARLTSQGAMLGTPAYMPPEQLRGLAVDARSDQWSFCATLYEALYGTRPFEGSTVAAVVVAMHNEGLRPAPDPTPVPRSVFVAIARGLELDAGERHPDMRSLLAALELRAPTRRRVLPIATAMLGLGVGGAWWWGAQDTDARCRARAGQAAALWSADIQQQAADAFERSGVSYATDSWTRASSRVTAYADAWAVEAARLCRGERPETAEVDDLRDKCLDARLRRLTSVTTAFADASDDVVRGAVATTIRLPGLEACSDVSSLLAAVRPPDDAESRAEIDRLEAALEIASAHKISADYAEGLRLAQQVVDEARSLGYAPLTADALKTVASFAARQGDNEVARDSYLEAFELAAEGRDDRAAAQAAVDLVYIHGSALRTPEAADAWTTVAASMVKRAGDTGRGPEASLHNVVGNLAFGRGEYERALEEFSAARDIWRALPGDHPIDLAFVLSNIGAVHATLGHYDEAREQHLQALKIREETFGPDHPDVAMSLGNLGIAAYKKGDMAAARDYQERGLAIKRATLPAGHLSLAANAMNLGLVFSRTGELPRAIEMFQQAIEIRTETLGDDHPDVAGAISNLAAVYYRQGELAQAERLHRQALAIREKALGPEHPQVGNSLQNLSETLLAMGRSEEAEPLVERGLAIFTKVLGPDHEAVGLSWTTLSRARAANGRLEEAVEAAEESVANAERSGQEAFGAAKQRIQLGKLRWQVGEDLPAARALIEQAAATMAKTPDREPAELTKVEAWLAAHPLP